VRDGNGVWVFHEYVDSKCRADQYRLSGLPTASTGTTPRASVAIASVFSYCAQSPSVASGTVFETPHDDTLVSYRVPGTWPCDARWAAAAQLAQGITDEGFHKRRARILLWIGVVIAASWITGFVAALWFLPKSSVGRGSGPHESSGQLIVQIVLLGLGLIVGIMGFIWAKRSGHYITRWRSVASPLNRREKKNVRRQLSGKIAPDTEHLPVVVAIANQSRRATLGVAPICAAAVLLAVSTAVGSNVTFLKLTELAVCLLFVIVAVQLVVLYRRTGLFIAQHGGQSH